MKNNSELQKDVQDAIKWEPLLNAAEIGVIVKEGIVTLTGTVDSFSKKSEAEDAAKKVNGVKAVVEKIEVKFSSTWARKDDSEIAAEVLNALKWNWQVPNDKVKVRVENGWITLEGELFWHTQKEAALYSVKNLNGVTGVTNNISIRSETPNDVEKQEIENALSRNWALAGKDINVRVNGHNVVLTGKVSSWYQKDEAARIVWNAPGVWEVDNQLTIEYDFSYSN